MQPPSWPWVHLTPQTPLFETDPATNGTAALTNVISSPPDFTEVTESSDIDFMTDDEPSDHEHPWYYVRHWGWCNVLYGILWSPTHFDWNHLTAQWTPVRWAYVRPVYP